MYKRIVKVLLVILLLGAFLFNNIACMERKDNIVSSERSFLSAVYSIDKNISWYWIFQQNDIVRLVVQTTEYAGDSFHDDYFLYSIEDGRINAEVPIPANTTNAFCGVGDNRIACINEINGYVLFDLNGNILAKYNGDDCSVIGISDIESSSEGFVVITSNMATLFDFDGNKIGDVLFDDNYYLSEEKSYFEIDNKKYLSIESDYGTTAYYELDFINSVFAFVADNKTFNLEDDMTTYRYGGYVYDEVNGLIGKLNFDNSSVDTLALLENCIIVPPEHVVSINIHTHILSDYNFAKVYRYDGERTDVVIISQADDIDLSDRTKITIKGKDINQDITLMWAIYEYNSSQPEYLICAEDYGESYYYETAEEAQQKKLELIVSFESDGAPDIYYGNDFDYDYFGKNGLVLNILDYTDINVFDDVTLGIKDILVNNNECYHVFAGYILFGYVGEKENYPLEDYCFDSLPNLTGYKRLFPEMTSVDLVDLMIRYAITSNKGVTRLLEKDNMMSIVKRAIDTGISPLEASLWGDYSGIGSRDYSLCLAYINASIKDYVYNCNTVGDDLSFVGFPSANDACHVIIPASNIAISSNSENIEACVDFIHVLLSDNVQSKNFINNYFPVSQTTFNQYMNYMKNPEQIPDDELTYKSMATTSYSYLDEYGHLVSREGYIELTDEEIAGFSDFIRNIDASECIDWGVYNIIREEMLSYYTAEKSIDDIVDALCSRLTVYYQENYT